MTIIYFILILSVIIVLHELGHLITAKYFHVYCKEFAIGMGPTIFKKQFKETTFAIRLLPLGGFVSMAGEEGVEDENIPFERTLKGIAWWKQIIIMAAGAIMNVLLAWVLFIGVTAVQGKVMLPSEPVIANFSENSIAKEKGFEIGDRIIKISNAKETIEPKTFDEVSEYLGYFPKEESTFILQRGNETITVNATPRYNEEQDRYLMGFTAKANIKEISALESIPYGTSKMVEGSTAIFRALGKLIRGIGLENLSGPVGIYQITAETTQNGLLPVFSLIALLSLNIGIFNLLPLPVLDGGRIFLTLIEKISGRKLSEKVETIIMMIGVVLLVLLMVFATWQDLLRLF